MAEHTTANLESQRQKIWTEVRFQNVTDLDTVMGAIMHTLGGDIWADECGQVKTAEGTFPVYAVCRLEYKGRMRESHPLYVVHTFGQLEGVNRVVISPHVSVLPESIAQIQRLYQG